MVEDRITDGYRIGELLASEVDGRLDGRLGRLAIANPDRTVEGSAAGQRAYDVRVLEGQRDPRREPTPEEAGDLLARVFVHGEGATVAVSGGTDAAAAAAAEAGLATDADWRDGVLGVRIECGAHVKRGADVLAAAGSAVE